MRSSVLRRSLRADLPPVRHAPVCWRTVRTETIYVRGTEEKPVRAVYEVPLELGFVVGDLTIAG